MTAAGWLFHLQAAVGVLAIIALNALLSAVGGVDGRVVRIATGMGVALVVLIVVVATGVLRGGTSAPPDRAMAGMIAGALAYAAWEGEHPVRYSCAS